MGIDDFIIGFLGSISEGHPENYQPMMPEIFTRLSDYPLLVGLLLIILSKSKTEDEYTLKLRYESAFIVLIATILVFIVVYASNPDFKIQPGIFILLQMLAYLIVRSVKGSTIFWLDYEEQA